MKARLKALIDWAMATRPALVWARFGRANGVLLANGMSFQSVFAAFAAIWVAFAAIGLWVAADSPLRDAIVATIANAVPGLIDDGEGGAIPLERLLSAQILGWTGAIATVGLAWTWIGWFGAARSAVRAMFGQLDIQQNAILLKLKDVALAAGFGVAILISAAVSLLATSLLGTVLGWLGIGDGHPVVAGASRAVVLLIGLAFDTAVLWGLYRLLSAAPLPRRALLQGAIGGAVGMGILKALGGALLGGAATNPLLASFAVIIGLLIWFNLVSIVLLLAAAWIGDAAERRAVAAARPASGGADVADPG